MFIIKSRDIECYTGNDDIHQGENILDTFRADIGAMRRKSSRWIPLRVNVCAYEVRMIIHGLGLHTFEIAVSRGRKTKSKFGKKGSLFLIKIEDDWIDQDDGLSFEILMTMLWMLYIVLKIKIHRI